MSKECPYVVHRNTAPPKFIPCQDHLEDLTQPRLTALPVIALVVPEDKIVALKIVHNAVNTAVTRDNLNPLALLDVLAGKLIRRRLGLEECDAEAARLEDANDMLNDIGCLATTLASRDVRLERGVGAVGLGGDVDGEVVSSIGTLLGAVGRAARSRHDAVGREAARSEQVGVDASVRILGGRVDISQTTVLGDDSTERVTLGGQLFREGKLLVRVEARVVGRGLLKDVEALVRDVGGGRRVENGGAAKTLALALGNGAKGLDGVFASLTSPLDIATFRDRTRVLEIELTGVLLIEISHQYLQGLVLLFIGVHLGQHALREAHNFGLGLRAFDLLGARAGRRGQGGVRARDIEVPVLAVHFANHVGTAALESLVQEADFVAPATVGTLLRFRVQEVLPAVEDAVGRGSSCEASARGWFYVRETSIDGSNLQEASETPEEGSGTAGLQHDLVREDEHARLREKVGIDVLRLNDRQNLAVDKVQHLLPDLSRHLLETKRTGLTGQVGSRGAEPYFQKLLRAFEGIGGIEVDSSFLVDSQVWRANVRGRRRGVVLRDFSSDHLLAMWRRCARSMRGLGVCVERGACALRFVRLVAN